METNLFENRDAILHPGRPIADAPPKTAPYAERAEWSERYVRWFLGQVETNGVLPKDVLPTHLYQVEFQYCVLDPQLYEQQTQQELAAEIAETFH
ncbi:hypothetical protein [Terricaulis sp.]|uniref:hypothetical protein n=1 Tax=Terricaulis sp. TaxID=2768686 RepID=UPI0037843A0F